MIEMFGFAGESSLCELIFPELLEDSGNYYTNMIEIQGGTDRLPHAFLDEIKDNIRFGAKMIAMDQSPDDVTIHYQTHAGRFSETGDYAIITVPFPVLRHVEVLKPFTRAKQRAIRQLHYDASAKILFQCKRRFWEDDDGIFGGGTLTDLPIPIILSHGRETGRGTCCQLHVV
jgi:monoamine oxidase